MVFDPGAPAAAAAAADAPTAGSRMPSGPLPCVRFPCRAESDTVDMGVLLRSSMPRPRMRSRGGVSMSDTTDPASMLSSYGARGCLTAFRDDRRAMARALDTLSTRAWSDPSSDVAT